jgi:lipid II:glycine glycyltransferase (peptidoglycan interpeptide bridge formation enzyme)
MLSFGLAGSSHRLLDVSARDSSFEAFTGVGALPFPAHEQSTGGDAGAVAPSPTAELPEGEQWDRFVMAAPGGDLVQTNVWAKAKRLLGLETCRVVLREDDRIIGGAQIVLKRFGPLGAVGYVARGPLTAGDRPPNVAQLLDQIERAARARRVRHMIIQPPQGGERVIAELQRRGYSPDAPAVAPSATLRIDLSRSLDQILASFSGNRRTQLRRSEREGVEIQTGDRSDLDAFLALHRATARRQRFRAMSEAYLRHHWDMLHARGAIQLILAYHRGQPLAGKLVTLFQDTVSSRLNGWTGDHPKLHAALACQWGTITWAKAQGFRCYDLGGVDRRYAELLSAGQPIPEVMLRSADNFKASLGTEAVLFPPAWHRTFVPFGDLAARLAYARLDRSGFLLSLIDHFRNG